MALPIISTAQVQAWCRIDADDDGLLTTLIAAAQEHAEAICGQSFTPINAPQGVKQAIAVFAADLYANREGQTMGDACFARLLAPYRVTGEL